ncbi:MAG: anion transporter [Dehalococcoidales bacterium]|nr:anion transporter [Dehalococcoidales bacterium]
MIPVITLAVVFLLIAVRQIGRIRFQIWQVMLIGAAAVLVTGNITPLNALKAIDIDVMLFLFGVFITGRALEESGYLASISSRLFGKARSTDTLILIILFGMGLLSAFLMNDTVVIIGTPVVLMLARKTGIKGKMLLLTLAFAVTIGSVMSPTGNPQNLLIAMHGNIDNPFVTFVRYLSIPTLINLAAAYLLLRLFYQKEFHSIPVSGISEPITDPDLAKLARLSLGLLIGMVIVKVILVCLKVPFDFRLTYIALISALPVILFSRSRIKIVKSIDWPTLVFFAAMFILMASVWESGYIQEITASMHLDMRSGGTIMGVSVLLSQLISNVPLVALYLPVISELGGTTAEMMALAAGSTIAGNLTILGAASNVIIIQNAEKHGGTTLTFFEFIRIGIPLTLVNCAVYWAFLML